VQQLHAGVLLVPQEAAPRVVRDRLDVQALPANVCQTAGVGDIVAVEGADLDELAIRLVAEEGVVQVGQALDLTGR
jgi:hypothetical protein